MMNIQASAKIRIDVIFIGEIVYYVEPSNYYDDGCRKIYKFIDDEGNIFIWKTSKALGIDCWVDEDTQEFESVDIGDRIFLQGTIKGTTTYKYEDQIMINRCRVLYIINKNEMSEDEIVNLQRNLQLSKLQNNVDIKTMTYREYKSDYQRCETVVGSFKRTDSGCFVDVIVPKENISSIYYYVE